MKIINLFKNTEINLDKTMTLSTNSGGVVTAQIYDALLFLEEIKLQEELLFLQHLLTSSTKPTQESILSFLKHLFFDASLAKQFVRWQRDARVA